MSPVVSAFLGLISDQMFVAFVPVFGQKIPENSFIVEPFEVKIISQVQETHLDEVYSAALTFSASTM